MSKCTECRKATALDTRWDRISRWFFFQLFPKQITDLSQEKFTQGFGDGYKMGYGHGVLKFSEQGQVEMVKFSKKINENQTQKSF